MKNIQIKDSEPGGAAAISDSLTAVDFYGGLMCHVG
jgi:hypothetical protein